MSEDEELRKLQRRRLLEMQRRLQEKKEEPAKPEVSPKEVLNRIFYGRAWEVWENAKRQFPKEMERFEKAFAELALSGKLKERMSGEQLLWLLRDLGLDVKMKTEIRIFESGELKTLAQKLKEQ